MSRKTEMASTARYERHLIESLKDPGEAQAHLEVALDAYEATGETEELLLAFRDVAEAQGGIGELARRAGVNREHLYRVLSNRSNPRMDNLLAIISGLGFRVRLEPQGVPAR